MHRTVFKHFTDTGYHLQLNYIQIVFDKTMCLNEDAVHYNSCNLCLLAKQMYLKLA